ncbi:family 4 glycosyl hydrolase [Amycolatopsis thermoflava]|uniref:family 4 glycosyl hydrolase n=1 Tax=Amycolatopsis thermoflava TaxID=84480 RepID=UPI00365A9C09
MRLTIIGGGGFRTPLIHRAVAGWGAVREIALYDSDPRRLAAIGAVLGNQNVVPHTDLDAALAGADFVFCAVRVGGTRGRVLDERIALDCGVLGQETTGAGGLAYGLRGVPVLTALARRIAELAPAAWVVNFTNPVGLITEAMAAVLGDRVIGICDSPAGLFRRVAWLLGVPEELAWFDYAGLNHLGWLRAVRVAGADRLPGLLAGDRLGAIEEGRLFGVPLLRELGMIPNEYLQYYYATAGAIEKARRGPTRGAFLHERQEAFYRAALAEPSAAARLWTDTLAEREATYSLAPAPASGEPAGGGYEAMAVAVMRSLAGDGAATPVLNVRNRGAVPGLPADAIVEVPCLVDTNGAHPIAGDPLPEAQLALARAVKTAERTTITAALTGSRALAEDAFAAHPLVGDRSVARRLVARYRAAHVALRALR